MQARVEAFEGIEDRLIKLTKNYDKAKRDLQECREELLLCEDVSIIRIKN